MRLIFCLIILLLFVGCQEKPLEITIGEPISEVSDKYLSVAIDMAQVIGEDWWNPNASTVLGIADDYDLEPFNFENGKLIGLSKELSPAYLRISGTKADNICYFCEDSKFTKERFDKIVNFSQQSGFELMFGLNAKDWNSGNAQELMDYANSSISIYEFGNEPNGYVMQGHKVNGEQYAEDFKEAEQLVPKLAGPGDAFFPIVGELFGITKDFLKNHNPKIISWHYYPQQSERCFIRIRKADDLLSYRKLDEVKKHANKLIKLRDKYSPKAEIWMTETGNAQCGGQPGISDTFSSSLWWADHLGLLATLDHQVVVRQTLAGSDYGLLDDNFDPNPDYYLSVLWKKLMGTTVLKVSSNDKKVRSYAHCKDGKITLLLINLDDSFKETNFSGELYALTSDSLNSKKVFLNGELINEIQPAFRDKVVLDPLSINFIVLEDSGVCS
ncbi:MAG: hypothetical protein ABIB47_01660 [Candidatus Woesearchaeota archaeon]